MYSVKDLWFFTIGVSPFGNPRVDAYFQLTAAYRRLSRPSSALGAKAFTLCSFSLEQLSCWFSLQKTSLAWVSQIIVWVVNSKDRAFDSTVFSTRVFSDSNGKIVFPTCFTERPSNLKSFLSEHLLLKNLSYNYLCFVSFFIRFSVSI